MTSWLIASLALSMAQPSAASTGVEEAVAAVQSGNYARALQLSQDYAAIGNPDAQYILGHLYQKALGVERDMTKAIEYYVSAAAAGQSNAQFALGELAYTGEAVQQDWDRAAEWFNLASAGGHMLAKTRLGFMYAEGQSVPKDPQRAAFMFEEAAKAGVPAAQYHLALLYLDGSGRRKDFDIAADWFRQAAENGDADSMYNLALLLESGRLKDGEDLAGTVRWMRAAAEKGIVPAKVSMGLLAYNGRGMTRAEGEAMQWFRAAAQDGDPEGMFLYAVALSEGLGGKPNFSAAQYWANKAVSSSGEGTPPGAMRERIGLQRQLEAVMAEQNRLTAQRERAARMAPLRNATLMPDSHGARSAEVPPLPSPISDATQEVAGEVLEIKEAQPNDVRRSRGLRR